MTTKIPVELSSTPGIVDGSNATAITIDSSEKVGIGTTSPSQTLHTSGTGVQRIQVDATDNNAAGAGLYMKVLNSGSLVGNATVRVDNTGNLDIFTGTSSESQKMTILAGGNVGIGETTPLASLHIKQGDSGLSSLNAAAHHLFLEDTGSNGPGITFASGTSSNCTLAFGDSDSNYQGVILYDNSADAMKFGTNGGAEDMRIDSSGNVLVGKTAANSATVGFEARADGRMFATASGSYSAMFNRTSSHGALLIFAKDDSQVGSISTNANSLPSDKNFKRDIEDLNIGLDLVTKLNPVSYNYKIDEDDCPKMFGLIAQDLETSLTEVGVTKNSSWLLQHEPTEDEKESDYALDYLKLNPILIKSIQEQQEQIEQLKPKVQN